MRENILNFATTALASPSPLTAGGTSFTVTVGQGTLFPTSNFLVTIEAEILLISSRSGDTFTVGQRGFDGTVAASHAAAVVVQLAICAYNLTHLWQNVADSYTPVVPPGQIGGSASSWDNEFEALGSWTLFPSSPAAGSTWNAGSSLRSHLLLDRVYNDNTLYTAYVPFNPPASTPFMVTMRLAQACNFISGANSGNQLQCWLAVTDQTNPVASVGTGNRFQLKTVLENVTQSTSNAQIINNQWNQPYIYQISAHAASSGASLAINPVLTFIPGASIYVRIHFDGTSTYTAYVGDGVTYWAFANRGTMTFTPQTIALQFLTSGAIAGTHAIDFIRVATGSVTPTFGS